jgi:2-dehydro-3-deoxygluconokinase
MPVVAIGECMLELVRIGECWQLNYAGDTFNTVLTMRRLGVPVGFLTALGVDAFSQEMRASWLREQIDSTLESKRRHCVAGAYHTLTTAQASGCRPPRVARAGADARRLPPAVRVSQLTRGSMGLPVRADS